MGGSWISKRPNGQRADGGAPAISTRFDKSSVKPVEGTTDRPILQLNAHVHLGREGEVVREPGQGVGLQALDPIRDRIEGDQGKKLTALARHRERVAVPDVSDAPTGKCA